MKLLCEKFDQPELESILKCLLLVRIAVLSIILGAATWDLVNNSLPNTDNNLIFSSIAITYILSLINILWLRKSKNLVSVALFQLLSDIVLSTLAACVTGTLVSLALYVLTIIGSALVFSSNIAILTSVLCAILFTLDIFAISPFLSGSKPAIKTNEILSVYLVLLAVALSTKYLRKRLEVLLSTIAAQEATLFALNESKQKLTLEVSEMEEKLSLHEKMNSLLEENKQDTPFLINAPHIVAESQQMKDVMILAQRSARSEANILITGARGTGKEMIARFIHQQSDRSALPFITVDCAAIPESMLEAELFGQKKGVTSLANTDKIGYIKQANAGTLFLDRVENLPLHIQGKLLRVIQDKTAKAVGDSKDYQSDIRIISTNSKNLSTEIKENRFRDDLFYRLSVVHINIPSLKERKADLPNLIKNIVKKLSQKNTIPGISPEALNYLYSYSYPGNITELETIIERALVLASENIHLEHVCPNSEYLKDSMYNPSQETSIITLPTSLESILEEIEKKYLETALANANGLKKNAAELLGLNFRSFRYRLKKYNLDSDFNEK